METRFLGMVLYVLQSNVLDVSLLHLHHLRTALTTVEAVTIRREKQILQGYVQFLGDTIVHVTFFHHPDGFHYFINYAKVPILHRGVIIDSIVYCFSDKSKVRLPTTIPNTSEMLQQR
jgi:hypothetical protein|mmetsp:Transcript_7260/g.16048  ORF Transcript_7260/g.16048 Transcript_7260/m.16048 type:complete len:118 (-) Transcript_7260:1079-1432(-)